jgi:hypothetical protein
MKSPGLRYWTTKARSVAIVDICYGVGGGVVSPRRVQSWKALAFSHPFWTGAWCGCLSVWSCFGWASFSACVLSPYMYLAVYYLCHLQMLRSSLCPSPATNRYARLFPSLPTLRNLGSGEGEGCGFLICCIWYPFDGSTSPVYMTFPLPWCWFDMLLPLLCTCHPSFCHCKNYCVVPLLFWVLVFCYAKDWI